MADHEPVFYPVAGPYFGAACGLLIAATSIFVDRALRDRVACYRTRTKGRRARFHACYSARRSRCIFAHRVYARCVSECGRDGRSRS